LKGAFGKRRHSTKWLVAFLLVAVSLVGVVGAAGSGGHGNHYGWGGWGGGWGGWGGGWGGNYNWYPSWPTYSTSSWDNDISNVNINVEAGNFLDIDVPGAFPGDPPCGGCGGSWSFPGLVIENFQNIGVDIDVDVDQ